LAALGIHKNTAPHSGIPQRSCIGCGRSRSKADLVRVALGGDGKPRVDAAGLMPGRGAYLCGSGCLAAAVKRKAFQRAFRGKVKWLDLSSLETALEK